MMIGKKHLPSYEVFNRPLPGWHPKAIYYRTLKLFLKTFGRLSDGIRIGLRSGFNSGAMLDYIYRNRASGITFLGRALDRAYLNSQESRCIRQRGGILKQFLLKIIKENSSQHITTVLLDVACGIARYDLEILWDLSPKTYQATLWDGNVENVQKAQQLASDLGVKATIEQADAFSDRDLDRVIPHPNLIILSGLHETVSDNYLVIRHFHQLFRILEPGGTLICTVQTDRPQLELITQMLNAHRPRSQMTKVRSLEQIKAWILAVGFTNLEVQMDFVGIYGAIVAKKGLQDR
jgi:SAM-dependent methyltransferase